MLQLADSNLIPLAGKARKIKKAAHLVRVEHRKEEKGEREDNRQGNRLIRIKGKGAAKTQRTVKKLARVTKHSPANIDTPDSGSMPDTSVPSTAMPAPSSGGGGNPISPGGESYSASSTSPSGGGGGGGGGSYPDSEEDDIDEGSYEQMPDEENDEESMNDPYNLSDVHQLNDPYDLSAGVFDTILKGAKGAGGGIINEFKKSKTLPSDHTAIAPVKKPDTKSGQMSEPTKMLLSAGAGAVTGYLLGKFLKF